MARYCQIHLDEAGERRPAVGTAKIEGERLHVCAECRDEIAQTAAAERRDQAKYDYACGYHD